VERDAAGPSSSCGETTNLKIHTTKMSSIFFPQRIQGDSYFRLKRLSIRFGAEWNAWFGVGLHLKHRANHAIVHDC
jgi:hypothetical protein